MLDIHCYSFQYISNTCSCMENRFQYYIDCLRSSCPHTLLNINNLDSKIQVYIHCICSHLSMKCNQQGTMCINNYLHIIQQGKQQHKYKSQGYNSNCQCMSNMHHFHIQNMLHNHYYKINKLEFLFDHNKPQLIHYCNLLCINYFSRKVENYMIHNDLESPNKQHIHCISHKHYLHHNIHQDKLYSKQIQANYRHLNILSITAKWGLNIYSKQYGIHHINSVKCQDRCCQDKIVCNLELNLSRKILLSKNYNYLLIRSIADIRYYMACMYCC